MKKKKQQRKKGLIALAITIILGLVFIFAISI